MDRRCAGSSNCRLATLTARSIDGDLHTFAQAGMLRSRQLGPAIGGPRCGLGASLSPLKAAGEAAMNQAALVHAGVFYIVVIQPLLLVTFIRAVIQAPPGPADSASRSAPGSPAPQVAGPQAPEWPRLRAGAAWPPGHPAGVPDETGYVGRHATRGGPPWGPAPKPPGADR